MVTQGDILGHKYRVEHKIYKGGMGVVCLCTDITEKKKHVVKYPFFNGRNDDIKLEKLKVEAEILKTISHPHIVEYIDSFEENNMFYMILEYIKGKDMKTLFKKKPVPESQVKNYAEQLLDALEYLHNENAIHRDIKPRNIMIAQNNLKLIDFGGAKMRFTSLDQEPTYLWTPRYGAPEQKAGECYYQSDIYGVGATLFFLLTGDDPCQVPPLSPRRENPKVTEGLDAIIQKATDLDPNRRFQTAIEMKKALSGVIKRVVYNPRLIIGSREFKITESEITIGRGSTRVCPDVALTDPGKYLSKIHARIKKEKGAYWIEDYSANGTFVFRDGSYKRIKKQQLSNNDVIAFCWNPEKGPYIVGKFILY
jgi:serine/threonine protein kinase